MELFSDNILDNEITYDCLEILSEISMIASICIILCRLWILYFDHRFSLANVDKIWQQSINISATDKNFWLNNRKTVGNVKYIISKILSTFLLSLSVFYALLTVIVWIATGHVTSHNHTNEKHHDNEFANLAVIIIRMLALLVMIILCIISIVVMFFKANTILDHFKIKQELTYLLCILSVYTVMILVYDLVCFQYNFTHSDSHSGMDISKVYYFINPSFKSATNVLYFASMISIQVWVVTI